MRKRILGTRKRPWEPNYIPSQIPHALGAASVPGQLENSPPRNMAGHPGIISYLPRSLNVMFGSRIYLPVPRNVSFDPRIVSAVPQKLTNIAID
jgi:hypothetical protein